MVWEVQKIVFDDVVYIIPFYSLNVQAYRTDRFQGWTTDAGKLELSDPHFANRHRTRQVSR